MMSNSLIDTVHAILLTPEQMQQYGKKILAKLNAHFQRQSDTVDYVEVAARRINNTHFSAECTQCIKKGRFELHEYEYPKTSANFVGSHMFLAHPKCIFESHVPRPIRRYPGIIVHVTGDTRGFKTLQKLHKRIRSMKKKCSMRKTH
jgi:hypothetical protein